MVELRNFLENLKNFKNILKSKKISRLKDWTEKIRNKEDIKKVLGGERISWLNIIQLERWTSEWNTKGKGRKMTKFEEIIEKILKSEEKTERKGTIS